MKLKIQIGFVLLVAMLLFSIVMWVRYTRSHVHDLPSIMESGRLSVLTDSGRMGFSVKGDSVSGFQYEIVKAFADTLGLELVVTEQSDLKACMEDLNSGDYDIIADFVPITTEWKGQALFTNPLFVSRQVLVQRFVTDSTLVTIPHQLANDSVFIPLNSAYKMRLMHLSDEIAEPVHIIEMKNMGTEQLVRMVAEGKIKNTICDEKFAKILKLQYPDIDISFPIGFEQQQAWVVHLKSPLLLARLNEFLSDFIGSSAYWEIYSKYH
ncbi:MAG TPA: transporter substrate-binding domain-containing protein [Paludibacter sp.]|nr:transporter substrate-binding domain-containing protein [Paludibacter sp.]